MSDLSVAAVIHTLDRENNIAKAVRSALVVCCVKASDDAQLTKGAADPVLDGTDIPERG